MLEVDSEFQSLIPPLTGDEYKQLEENIIKEGCRDALVTWGGIILDGHNRHEICTRKKIPYKTEAIKLKSRDEAVEWIIKNQFGRRNLTLYERGRLALRLENIWRDKAKENQVVRKGGQQGATLPNSAKLNQVDTRKEIAKVAGLAGSTIGYIKVIEKEATPEQKADLVSGKKKVNRVYKELRPDKPKEQPAEIEQKVCGVCGIRKPITDFYCKRNGQPNPQCKQCELFIRKTENPTETREKLKALNGHVIDGVDTILESMKTKKPAEAGAMENLYSQSVAELMDIFNQFYTDINKFLYMGNLLKNQPLPIELMEKTVSSIKTIMNFKGDK